MRTPNPSTPEATRPATHTPGPWEAFDHAGENMQSYSQSSGVHGTGKHIGTLVCGCFHDIEGGKKAAYANARLIAAAPDMLAALKAFNLFSAMIGKDARPSWFKDDGAWTEFVIADEYRKAAISKAERAQ